MVFLAWLLLRLPDIGGVIAFFTTGSPSLAAGEAVARLLAWLAVGLVAAVTVVRVVRELRTSRRGRNAASPASLCLAFGFVLLTAGVVQHSQPSASVCCGSGASNIREATQLAR
jgi:uncharacterized membrane protein